MKDKNPSEIFTWHNSLPVFRYDDNPFYYCDYQFIESLLGARDSYTENKSQHHEDRDTYSVRWSDVRDFWDDDGPPTLSIEVLMEKDEHLYNATEIIATQTSHYGDGEKIVTTQHVLLDKGEYTTDMPNACDTRLFYGSMPRIIWSLMCGTPLMFKEWGCMDAEKYQKYHDTIERLMNAKDEYNENLYK